MPREPTNGELLGARLICLALAVFSAIAAVAIFREATSATIYVYGFAAASLSLGVIGMGAPRVAWSIARIVFPG